VTDKTKTTTNDNDSNQSSEALMTRDDAQREMALTHSSAGNGARVQQLGNLDPGDFLMPRLKLVQPTSADLKAAGSREGWFHDTLSGDDYERLIIVPLAIDKGRNVYDGEHTLCSSSDCLVPDSHIETPFSDKCGYRAPGGRIIETCYQAAKGKDCKIGYQLIACRIEVDENGEHCGVMPFAIRLKGYGTDAALAIKTWCEAQNRRYHDVQCELYAVPKKNAKGSFFMPRVRTFKKLDEGRYDEFATLFAGMVPADDEEEIAF